MRNPRHRVPFVCLALACLVALADDTGGAGGTAPAEPPIHADPVELVRSIGRAVECLAREDVPCARAALDRVEANCRRLLPDPESRYDDAVRSWDRGFHVALDRARELANVGDVARMNEQFVWTFKTCRLCHAASRDLGIGPDLPVPAGPDVDEN